MSSIAEKAYKSNNRNIKGWFTHTNKDRGRSINFDPLKKEYETPYNWYDLKLNNPLITDGRITSLENIEYIDNVVRLQVNKPRQVAMKKQVGAQFANLASEWKHSIRIISNWNQMILHPCYQRIIGLGPDVIPYILNDLKQNGGHWFWALQALTGENPIAEDDAGKTRKMAEAWLSWGKERGYI